MYSEVQQIGVALRFVRLPVISDDVIVTSGPCILKLALIGYDNDVIRHYRKLEHILMQHQFAEHHYAKK